MNCEQCNINIILKMLTDISEKRSWHCMNTTWSKYKSTISIRKVFLGLLDSYSYSFNSVYLLDEWRAEI